MPWPELYKTLTEMVKLNLMQQNIKDQDIVIKTNVKDGVDGVEEVAVQKEKEDRRLPDKVPRLSFCVLQCVITLNDKEIIILQEESPNSVKSNRPLLEVIADENTHASHSSVYEPYRKGKRTC